MSEPRDNPDVEIRQAVSQYYAGRLRQFGATARGVDWPTSESQQLRFTRLLLVVERPAAGVLLDFGCGYGALLDHLRASGYGLGYQGFDISEEMIDAAKSEHAAVPDAAFTSDQAALQPVAYAVASGIFNVKLSYPADVWRAYVLSTIETLHALSTDGFAFNMLTTYSDIEKRRDDLYYADPLETFDLCKRRFSTRVALLHDYPLYEFTIIVRK
jgi:SAM-dependent methyltransferase